MGVAVTVVCVLLALAMGSSFARKQIGDASTERLRRQLRVTPPLWRAIGVIELGAAVGLLVGLSLGPVGIAAGVGVAALMLGAIVLHLRVGIAGEALVAPTVVLVVGAAAAALRFSTL